MDNFHFTPAKSARAEIPLPHIEEARADFAPYYATGISLVNAQAAVTAELGKLGATAPFFDEGVFEDGTLRRLGYVITFQYGGARGRLLAVGLPMKFKETEAKRKQVLVQALLNIRDQLKAEVTSRVFNLRSDPLLQYLLVNDTQTVAETMHEKGVLPALESRNAR